MTASGTAIAVNELRRGARRAPGLPSTAWLFVAPTLLLIAVFIVYPTLWTIRLSFYSGQGFNFGRFVGWDHYVRLFTQDLFFLKLDLPPSGAVINNILWLALYTPLVLGIGLVIAVLADKVRYESIIKSVVFVPMGISATAAAVMWLFIYSPNPEVGLLNAILTRFIPDFQPLSWTGDVRLVNPAIIVVAVWINVGLVTVVLSAALKGISAEILEAARVDGANAWQIFGRIQVPLLAPTITVLAVTMIIYVIKMFDLIYVMGGPSGGPLGAARVIAFTQYVETFNNGRAGYGSAVAVIMLLVVIPIMALNVRRFRREAAPR